MVACSTPAILAVIAGAEILLVVLDDLSPTIATTRAPTDIRPWRLRCQTHLAGRRRGSANLQDGPRAELAKKLSHFSDAPPRGSLALI